VLEAGIPVFNPAKLRQPALKHGDIALHLRIGGTDAEHRDEADDHETTSVVSRPCSPRECLVLRLSAGWRFKASRPELRIMRYELADFEWAAIKPMLPNKPRGVPRRDDRRVLNGIFWVLRSGAPWRDLPQGFGPYTTCYNRFVRWRRAGVWNRIMEAVAAAHDAAVQMIDTSIVRVHQHAACIARNKKQSMGRSRGGLSSKIHAVIDKNGLPVRLALTAGEAHDNRLAAKLLSRLKSGAMLLADRGYDADWIRALVRQHGAWANIPPRRNRKDTCAQAASPLTLCWRCPVCGKTSIMKVSSLAA
jgi:transposase